MTQPPRRPIALPPLEDRIGQHLARAVSLSRHQVYEVMEEQAVTGRKFGQIAIGLGLCRPTDVWQAWATQSLGRSPRVNLDTVGVDAQAAGELPAAVAAALGLMPVRSTADRLIIATSADRLPRAIEAMAGRTAKAVSFVVADEAQIARAVERYYARPVAPPEASAPRRCGSRCMGDACPSRARCRA